MPIANGDEVPSTSSGQAFASLRTTGYERAWRRAVRKSMSSEDVLLHDLAAARGAAHDVGGRDPALALAGVLALAGGVRGLAGARALARIDAGALHRAG